MESLASKEHREKENPSQWLGFQNSGPYRDRTDDIHGVSVALYQLS